MSNANLGLLKIIEKGYHINEEGKLYNNKQNELKGQIKGNYKGIGVRLNKTSTVFVKFHRIQAYQKFKEEIFKEGIVVRHLNGNSFDNSIENIEIGTMSDNIFDIPKKDRIVHAKNAAFYQIKHNCEEIKNFYKKNKSYIKTMEYFNISSKGTLWHILNKRETN